MEDEAVRIVRQRSEEREAMKRAEQRALAQEQMKERERLVPFIDGQITLALKRLREKAYERGVLVKKGDGETVEWRIATVVRERIAGDDMLDEFLLNSDRDIMRRETDRPNHGMSAGTPCDWRNLPVSVLREIAAGIQKLGK